MSVETEAQNGFQASHGIVAAITGAVSAFLSWLTLKGKTDRSACIATHKAVDETLARLERSQVSITDKLDEIKTLVLTRIK